MISRIDMGTRVSGEKAKLADEFVTRSQLMAGSGITIVSEANNDLTIMSSSDSHIRSLANNYFVNAPIWLPVHTFTLPADKRIVIEVQNEWHRNGTATCNLYHRLRPSIVGGYLVMLNGSRFKKSNSIFDMIPLYDPFVETSIDLTSDETLTEIEKFHFTTYEARTYTWEVKADMGENGYMTSGLLGHWW